MQNSYTLVSGTVFGVVAIVQAIRIVNQWPVQVGPIDVPIAFSWIAAIVAGGLCVWAMRSRRG